MPPCNRIARPGLIAGSEFRRARSRLKEGIHVTDAGGLIGSEAWSELLRRGFGSSRLDFNTVGMGASTTWTTFSRLGIKAAYAGFPVGFDEAAPDTLRNISPMLAALRGAGVDIARFSLPGAVEVPGVDAGGVTDLTETSIESLEIWSEGSLSASVRRKIGKSRRMGAMIRPAEPNDGSLLHGMYAEMIGRHRGRLRYTESYFDALCALAASDARLSIGVVVDGEASPCGFIAAAHARTVSHYLHGGFASRCASLRPGYLAMAWAIERSRDYGSERFNMLTSPKGQPALVAYKESFGGKSYVRRHYDVPLSPVGRFCSWGLGLVNGWRRADR
jgi:hypothetical protein